MALEQRLQMFQTRLLILKLLLQSGVLVLYLDRRAFDDLLRRLHLVFLLQQLFQLELQLAYFRLVLFDNLLEVEFLLTLILSMGNACKVQLLLIFHFVFFQLVLQRLNLLQFIVQTYSTVFIINIPCIFFSIVCIFSPSKTKVHFRSLIVFSFSSC